MSGSGWGEGWGGVHGVDGGEIGPAVGVGRWGRGSVAMRRRDR